MSFGGVSDGLLSFYVSTAGHEAATNLAFNLERRPRRPRGGRRRTLGGCHPHGGVVGRGVVAGDQRFGAAGVAAPEPLGHDAGPGGHVADASRWSRSSPAAARRRRAVRPARARAWDRARPTTAPAVRETSRAMRPSQEIAGDRRAGDGVGAAGDRPGAVLGTGARRDPGGRRPIAGCGEPKGDGSARDWPKLAPPVPTPARPTTRDRTGAQARPAASSEAAMVAPLLPVVASSIPRPEGTGRAVDAVLGDLGADREADGPGLGILGRAGQGPGSGPDPSTGCGGRVGRGGGYGMDAGPKSDPSTTFGLDTSPLRVCSIKRWFQKGDRHLEDSEPVPVLKQLARSYPMVLEGVARPVVTRHVSARLEVPRPNHGLTPVVTASRHLSEPTLRLRVRVA